MEFYKHKRLYPLVSCCSSFSAKETILCQLHDGITGGHVEIKKTLLKVQKPYFWFNLKNIVAEIIVFTVAIKNPPPNSWRAHLKQYNVGAPF